MSDPVLPGNDLRFPKGKIGGLLGKMFDSKSAPPLVVTSEFISFDKHKVYYKDIQSPNHMLDKGRGGPMFSYVKIVTNDEIEISLNLMAYISKEYLGYVFLRINDTWAAAKSRGVFNNFSPDDFRF